MRPQTETSMEPLWAWQEKTKTTVKRQTNKQTNEKEQDKHHYKNNNYAITVIFLSGA